MIGNSDAYAGFSPMEIWNSYGITSYVCGTGHQSINESVDVLKQIMQNQKPKVVMYEVDALWTDFDPATVMLKETERRVSNQLTVFKYHDLWKHFNSKALSQKKNYTAHFVTKGQNVNACQVPYDGDEYMVKTDKSKKVSQLFKPYLDEFVKVCKDNNVELVFVEFPSPVSWSYEKYNYISDYADKNDIKFIDFDVDRTLMSLDQSTDFRDGTSHLNCYGAKKASLYLGQYLEDTYSFDDKRSNPDYQQWNDDYKQYEKLVAKAEQKAKTEPKIKSTV
jgi:hypothetical protein